MFQFGKNALSSCDAFISATCQIVSLQQEKTNKKSSWTCTVLPFLRCFNFTSLVTDSTHKLKLFIHSLIREDNDRQMAPYYSSRSAQSTVRSWYNYMKWPPSSCSYSCFQYFFFLNAEIFNVTQTFTMQDTLLI